MIIWSPGVSLEVMEERVINEAMLFYKDEKRVADSLKITHKDLTKKLKKYSEHHREMEEARDRERIKHDDFVLRSRGLSSRL